MFKIIVKSLDGYNRLTCWQFWIRFANLTSRTRRRSSLMVESFKNNIRCIEESQLFKESVSERCSTFTPHSLTPLAPRVKLYLTALHDRCKWKEIIHKILYVRIWYLIPLSSQPVFEFCVLFMHYLLLAVLSGWWNVNNWPLSHIALRRRGNFDRKYRGLNRNDKRILA